VQTGGIPIPQECGSSDILIYQRCVVLAELLEVQLTELANRGYTPWHTRVDDIAQLSGRIRRGLEVL